MKSAYFVIASSLLVAACAAPFPGTVTELDASDPECPSSEALDVSDTGRIVGFCRVPGSSVEQAVEFEETGAVLHMPTPVGYLTCRAVAVANDGSIAGTCRVGINDRSTAFFAASIRAPLVFLTPQDGVLSHAVDMNERGVILGVNKAFGARDLSSWIYDTATQTLRELPGPPGATTAAAAINDAGDIVGRTTVVRDGIAHDQGVKWSGDSLTITSLPLVPTDINNRGDIVGSNLYLPAGTTTPQALPEPVLPPGRLFVNAMATDLNDEGFIIGAGQYFALTSDAPLFMGLVWPPGGVIPLADGIQALAVNASRVIVGSARAKAVRLDWAGP